MFNIIYKIIFIYWNWQMAEGLRETWERSDNIIVQKIQE